MKRIVTGLCAALLLFTMVGCSDATTNVSDKNETLITIGNEKITKGDVYEGLLAQGNITPVTEALTKAIAAKAVETTDEIKDSAKASMDALKTNNKDWDAYLKTNGYTNEDELLDELIVQVKESKITTSYVSELYETLVTRFEPRKLQVISISEDKKDKVNEAHKKAKDGEDFTEIADTYGNGKYVGKESVYTNASGLGADVWKTVLETAEGEVSKQAAYDPENKIYYIIKVVDAKTNEFKDEAVSVIASVSETNDEGLKMNEEAFKYYLNKFDYSIHDVTVYSALLNSSKMYEKE